MFRERFNTQIWRNYYNQVQNLAQYLKDSRPDEDGNPPKYTLSDKVKRQTQKEIDKILKISSEYLDRTRIYPYDALWRYDVNNPTTWASSKEFIYPHLLCTKKVVKVKFR